MTTMLLDSNVLIALAVQEHVHHPAALDWLAASDASVATCPITQGALIRTLLRGGVEQELAADDLRRISSLQRHEFWPDDLAYTEVRMAGVIGHRQVTDAYLAALARKRGGRLATFDAGLAALHADVVELVPAR